MGRIHKLSTDLINKIAAGEVVERPASVAKELIENAIDAGAEEITLKVSKGGIESIEVIDDGVGMDGNDAKLVFTQHATSKIATLDDLSSILSLGFRGEALASISSVSEAHIHTYDGNNLPLEVINNSGKISINKGPGRKKGTTVTIRNIFANIPARRKFLRSESTEYRHILDIFNNIALTAYKVSFRLIKDSKEVAFYLSTDMQDKRIIQIYKNLENKLIQLHFNSPELKINGYIGHPSTSRRDRSQQFISINDRPIKDHLISKAVKQGYKTSLMNDKHPIFFLNINIKPDLVDVNIHPRKQEVKFSNPGFIFQSVKNAVSKSLENTFQNDLKDKFAKEDTTSLPNRPQMSFKPNKSNKSYLASTPSKEYISKDSVSSSIEFTKSLLKDQNPYQEINSPIFELEQNTQTGQISQYLNTYLITERDNNILIIDQHAADERVKFEAFQDQFDNDKIDSQALLIPEELELSPSELESTKQYLTEIEKLGFKIEPLSRNSYQLTEVPSLLANTNYIETLKEITSDLSNTAGTSSESFMSAKNNIIATMACHGSIRAGRKVHQEEAEKLIEDLFNCKLPYSCPHGRPIIWELSQYHIEKQFKRKL